MRPGIPVGCKGRADCLAGAPGRGGGEGEGRRGGRAKPALPSAWRKENPTGTRIGYSTTSLKMRKSRTRFLLRGALLFVFVLLWRFMQSRLYNKETSVFSSSEYHILSFIIFSLLPVEPYHLSVSLGFYFVFPPFRRGRHLQARPALRMYFSFFLFFFSFSGELGMEEPHHDDGRVPNGFAGDCRTRMGNRKICKITTSAAMALRAACTYEREPPRC